MRWRVFLESLRQAAIRGVLFVVSDDHAGLRPARKAILGGAIWHKTPYSVQNRTDLPDTLYWSVSEGKSAGVAATPLLAPLKNIPLSVARKNEPMGLCFMVKSTSRK